MASMASGGDLKWTSPHHNSYQPGMEHCGDHGFYPHMAAARDIQQSFLGASPMSHFAAGAASGDAPSATEGKPTMTIS